MLLLTVRKLSAGDLGILLMSAKSTMLYQTKLLVDPPLYLTFIAQSFFELPMPSPSTLRSGDSKMRDRAQPMGEHQIASMHLPR